MAGDAAGGAVGAGATGDAARAVVVGIDGSDGSDAAIDWGCDEAALRGAELRLVHCWDYPYLGTLDLVGADDRFRTAAESAAREVLAEAERRIAGRAGGRRPASVTTELLNSSPGPGLLRAAADASLLVVGARGRGGFLGLLLGSVSASVAAHSPVPVVVVRAPGEPAERDRG